MSSIFFNFLIRSSAEILVLSKITRIELIDCTISKIQSFMCVTILFLVLEILLINLELVGQLYDTKIDLSLKTKYVLGLPSIKFFIYFF